MESDSSSETSFPLPKEVPGEPLDQQASQEPFPRQGFRQEAGRPSLQRDSPTSFLLDLPNFPDLSKADLNGQNPNIQVMLISRKPLWVQNTQNLAFLSSYDPSRQEALLFWATHGSSQLLFSWLHPCCSCCCPFISVVERQLFPFLARYIRFHIVYMEKDLQPEPLILN